MNDTSSLEAACSLFLQNSKANPFDTWLIVENEDVRRRAFEIIKTPVLQSRITTIKSLAHTILEEQKAGIRIIPPEEQYQKILLELITRIRIIVQLDSRMLRTPSTLS